MHNWTQTLRKVIPSPCDERPFVCDGFPDTCEVIVIGDNPATRLTTDWWSFWSDTSGFDYNHFLEVYQTERDKAGKGQVSNTRRRLDRIRANGLNCIETNTFRNEGSDGTRYNVSNYDVLKILLSNMPLLKGIIAHGKVAHECLDYIEVPVAVQTFKLRHFFQESYAEIDRICQEIRGI